MDKVLTPVEYAQAFYQVGPSITAVAELLGVRRSDVVRALRDQGVKFAYDRMVQSILESIERFGCNPTVIAQIYGAPRYRVESWFAESPRLKLARTDYYEEYVDLAELNLGAALRAGERWATEKVLATQGAKRGWGETVTFNLERKAEELGLNLPAIMNEIAGLLTTDGDEAGDETESGVDPVS